MQMQVIVSACFSLYTFESNSSVAQPVAPSIANNSPFNYNQKPFHHQSNHISLNKRPYSPQTFTNHPTDAILFICSQTQNKRAKTRPFVSFSPFMLYKFTQTSAFSICFLFFSHANAPLKQSESNKTPISFSSKYIDQSFYIDASPPCLCVVPFSNRYTSQQEPHRF